MSREIPSKKEERLLVDLSDDGTKYLMGWPGYRNADGRSGLGYIETQAEWAHMQGLFFRWLITGKFKTRSPIYGILLTVYGILSASPILLLFAGSEGRQGLLQGITIFGPSIFIGVLLLLNMILSLFGCDEGEDITGP
jgi:hypothetical protein